VTSEEYVETILQVAERDPGIATILREICSLPAAVRSGALELVGAHLRTQAAPGDILECVQALGEDRVADRIAERLGPPG